MEIWRIAYRNLLRNKRRTWITLVSVAFGMAVVVFTNTVTKGTHEKNIEDGIKRSSGHFQLHYRGYQENQILYNSLELGKLDLNNIAAIPGIKALLYRITTAGLVESHGRTRLVMVRGLDPQPEQPYGGFSTSLVDGDYLDSADQDGVYIGQGLAEYLGVRVGDPLFLIGEARDMTVAAGRVRVRGIFRTGNGELDRQYMLINKQRAEEIFVMQGYVTEMVFMLDSYELIDRVSGQLRSMIGPDSEIVVWDDIIPEMKQMVALDAAFGYLFLLILLIVVAFGIMNTILMATLERKKEFAVVLAIGAERSYLAKLILAEGTFLSLAAVGLGLLLGVPASLYFVSHPIPITGDSAKAFETWGFEPLIRGRLTWLNIMGSSIFFMILGWISSLWPARLASRTAVSRNLAGKY